VAAQALSLVLSFILYGALFGWSFTLVQGMPYHLIHSHGEGALLFTLGYTQMMQSVSGCVSLF